MKQTRLVRKPGIPKIQQQWHNDATELPTVSELRGLINSSSNLNNWLHEGREYVGCSPEFFCPNCGANSWCYAASDGRHVFCSNADDNDGVRTGSGDHVCIRLHDDTGEEPADVIPLRGVEFGDDLQSERGDQEDIDQWARKAKQAVRALKPRHLQQLAQRLGVSEASITTLDVGYQTWPAAWTMPEWNEHGEVVGISQRFVEPRPGTDGGWPTKAAMSRSKRGICYEAEWADHEGPVLIVEGFSDTAAAITLDLSAIGRPSNSGGADKIAALLADLTQDREIIVLAEHDEKEDGRCPGQEGATRVAAKLANSLQKPVSWGFVGPHKDLRAYLNDTTAGDLSSSGLKKCRRKLLRMIHDGLNQVVPDHHYRVPVPGPAIDLDEVRQQMSSARDDSLLKPGLYLDRSPTGSGKSYADNCAVAKALAASKRVAIVVPTHDNCQEVAGDLRKDHGVVAAVYPRLDENNCRRYAEAEVCVNHFGLNLFATLCLSCEHRDDCGYRAGVAAARTADAVVATHKRLEMDAKLLSGRRFVSVHEACDDALVPQFLLSEQELTALASSLRDAAARWQEYSGAYCSFAPAIRWLQESASIIDRMLATKDECPPTKAQFEEQCTLPQDWSQLFRSALTWNCSPSAAVPLPYKPDTLKGVVAVACRQAAWQWQSWNSKGQTYRQLLVQERLRFPRQATVWLGDATAAADRLRRLTRLDIKDCTPSGSLPQFQDVAVMPRDITRQTRPKTVAAQLRAVLFLEQPERLGVIGHQHHMRAILDEDSDDPCRLSEMLRQRVHMWSYFGQGTDRASNKWLECDLLLVLGTPRLSELAIREKLFQLGYGPEALIEPTWMTFTFDAETLYGPACKVSSKAYKEQVWHDECLYQTRSALLQAIGRARPILESGVPVLVFSNSLLHELPYAPSYPAGGATPGLMDAVESVWRICQKKPYARNRDVAADLEKDKGNLAKMLRAATDCSFIERVGRGKYRPVRPPGRDDILPDESCNIA